LPFLPIFIIVLTIYDLQLITYNSQLIMVPDYDLIIVGGGASGLLAARELSKSGLKIAVIEARDRFGGRIHTLNVPSSPLPIELGAEFIHGELPITTRLLNEAVIRYKPAFGDTWTVKKGQVQKTGNIDPDWDLFEEKLRDLDEDMSLKSFLNSHFKGDQFETLRNSVGRFAAGYDTADIEIASTLALRDEWLGEFNGSQDYRIKGGYGCLIDNLVAYLKSQERVELILSAVIKDVSWCRGMVKVTTDNGRIYTSGKVLITVPLGVLRAEEEERGHINFFPRIPQMSKAVKALGFGDLIKIILLFKEPFWERLYPEMERMEFLLAETPISAWWTQFPERSSVFTAWLGGPQASLFTSSSREVILKEALGSLEAIFKIPSGDLDRQLVDAYVINWSADPFTRGSYSYATVDSADAKKVLNTPIEDTIFFAGEGLYDGPAMGTVEAAFDSSLQAVKKILERY
jgi:monoamine oxidase